MKMLLLPLLAAMALVSMQVEFVGSAQIHKNKGIMKKFLTDCKRRNHRYSTDIDGMQELPKVVHHEPGVDLELTCCAVGSPPPQMQWMKNGYPVNNFNEEFNDFFPVNPETTAMVNSTLIISSPSSNPKDVYTCVATSGAKETQQTTTVLTDTQNAEDYLQRLLDLPAKPRISYFYAAVLLIIGNNVVLPCRATSELDTQTIWTDNNDTIVLENHIAKILPSGDLFIPKVGWEYMGDWTCITKNYLGEDSKTTLVYPALSEKT